MVKLNYNIIVPGDVVLTTSLSSIGCGIRIKEAGVKNIFNTRIATHVGIIVPIRDNPRILAIAEMLYDGLHIRNLSNYLNQGYFGDRIVDIKRFQPFFNNVYITNQIFSWWEKGKKFDYFGILEYIFPFIRDKDNRFYCSEMIEWLALNITKRSLIENKKSLSDNIMPYEIQKSKLLISVDWRN